MGCAWSGSACASSLAQGCSDNTTESACGGATGCAWASNACGASLLKDALTTPPRLLAEVPQDVPGPVPPVPHPLLLDALTTPPRLLAEVPPDAPGLPTPAELPSLKDALTTPPRLLAEVPQDRLVRFRLCFFPCSRMR